MPNFLNPGDYLPSLSLGLAGSERLSLPNDLQAPMTIALFYRGH